MASSFEQSNTCLNCNRPLPAEAKYCQHCGQQKIKGLLSLRELIADLVSSIFNLESRLWRTLLALVVPGKLTESYFQGRRASLLTPFRIFFIVAVAHFAILAIRIHGSVRDSLERFALQQQEGAYARQYAVHLDSLILETKSNFPQASSALDTLQAKSQTKKNELLDAHFSVMEYKSGQFGPGTTIEFEDLITLPREALLKQYALTDPFSRLQIQVLQRMIQNPDNFFQFLLSKLIWLGIVLVPALAVVLQLLYLRRKRYFVEHLVFSLHYHTFAFAIMGVFFQFSFQHPQYFGWFLLLLLIYGYLAMKRFYGQSWRKTFLKFSILHIFYLFLVSFSQLIVFLLSAIVYGNS